MTSPAPHVKPPHGIGLARWERVKEAFRDGGYIKSYEADAYLMLTRGTIKQAALNGEIAFTPRPFGNKTQYLIHAHDAEDIFGVKRNRAS